MKNINLIVTISKIIGGKIMENIGTMSIGVEKKPALDNTLEDKYQTSKYDLFKALEKRGYIIAQDFVVKYLNKGKLASALTKGQAKMLEETAMDLTKQGKENAAGLAYKILLANQTLQKQGNGGNGETLFNVMESRPAIKG